MTSDEAEKVLAKARAESEARIAESRRRTESAADTLWIFNVFVAGLFDAGAILLSVLLGAAIAEDNTGIPLWPLAFGIALLTAVSAFIKHKAK